MPAAKKLSRRGPSLFICERLSHGHWMKPWAHRHPPQVGAEFPKQSSWFEPAISQELQTVQGEKSNLNSRARSSR